MSRFLDTLLSKIAFFSPGGASLRPSLHRLRGVKIGEGVWISQYVYLDELYPESISIGNNSTIGLRTSIFTHFHWGPKKHEGGSKAVTIEDDVFIGPHSLILPGVRIGTGSVIKAGTVVSRNIPSKTLVGPAALQALGKVDTPLTPKTDYDKFASGIRPIRRRK